MLKRFMDVTLSLVVLILLLPILIIIAASIFITSGFPIFFKQNRVGYKGKIFPMIKFRTMREVKAGEDKHDMARLTSTGKFLRSLSLDELPELFHIIKGDMSLVGPRPLLVEYIPRYNKEQFRRHEVRPGLTGWAQINGRNTLTWDEKFRHDVWYVDHQSFFLDLKIIFLTAWKMVKREGVNASEAETMEEFDPGIYVIGSGSLAEKAVAIIKENGMGFSGILPDVESLSGRKIKAAVLAEEDSKRREELAKLSLNWITLIHPEAEIHETAVIERGSIILSGARVKNDAIIGSYSVVGELAIVESRNVVPPHVYIGFDGINKDVI